MLPSTVAIPIPKKEQLSGTPDGRNNNTPSLQSVLDQKRLSNMSLSLSNSRASVSSINTTTSDPSSPSSSLPSLVSISSVDSCDTHPLESANVMTEIDQDFFNFSVNHKDVELRQPIMDYNCERESFIKESTPAVVKKSSFVSNLTKSIKNFTSSTTKQNDDFNLFNIQPRLTDDKLPSALLRPSSSPTDTELETFKITSRSHTTIPNPLRSPTATIPSQTASSQKNREARINSQFLRLYAYESSSRQKGLLPVLSQQEEDHYLHSSSSKTQSIKHAQDDREFALLVRQRLWQCVVLPPREDSLTVSSPDYVYTESHNASKDENVSLIRTLGDVKPWIKLEDEKNSLTSTVLKPRGVLGRGIQFTVKGWSNPRWISRDD